MNTSSEQAGLRRQLEAHGITDLRVLDVMERTRRDLFVPEEMQALAFADCALPIGSGQTISQPYIVALMTQSLELDGSEKVLEIGTGSGYQTAVLSQLCREIVTVERLEELAVRARDVLSHLGIENVHYRFGDGTLGCPEFAPYDGIIVTAASPAVPEPLFRQLNPGGRMIIPVGEERRQKLLVVENRDGEVFTRAICDCSFVKLIGAAGWPAE